jgi:predicted DsbA family dithiol-disulfide isomerase
MRKESQVKPIRIVHFSDTLCVWAYVSQVRLDELLRNFPESVVLESRYLHVFGDVARKMETAWKDRGGVRGYSEQVRTDAGKFDHVTLHPQVWVLDTPRSSMPSHIFLCAVRLLEAEGSLPPGTLSRTAWGLRKAFFQQGADISRRETLYAVAEGLGLSVAPIDANLASGAAHAALCEDLDLV